MQTSATTEDLRCQAIERLQLSGPGEEPAFDRLARLAATLLGAPMAALTVVGAQAQSFKAAVGFAGRDVANAQSPCAAAIAGGQPLVIEDLARDARFRANPLVQGAPRMRFYAGVPVRTPGQWAVGTLCVMDVQPRAPTDAMLDGLRDLAILAERELMLRSLARTDAVTGIFNRTYLDTEIDREWRRALRQRLPVTALLFDVDWFRDYNEAFGRHGGDHALRQTAAILSEQFRRAGDLVVRYADEEFLALLPETTGAEGLRLADAARTRVLNLGLGNPGSPVGLLTVSAGCATADSDHGLMRGYAQLLEEADLALARAKRGGRNRVERYFVG